MTSKKHLTQYNGICWWKHQIYRMDQKCLYSDWNMHQKQWKYHQILQAVMVIMDFCFFCSHSLLWFPVSKFNFWLSSGICLVCSSIFGFLVWTVPFCLSSFLTQIFLQMTVLQWRPGLYIVLGISNCYGCFICKMPYCIICTLFWDYSYNLWILFYPQA